MATYANPAAFLNAKWILFFLLISHAPQDFPNPLGIIYWWQITFSIASNTTTTKIIVI